MPDRVVFRAVKLATLLPVALLPLGCGAGDPKAFTASYVDDVAAGRHEQARARHCSSAGPGLTVHDFRSSMRPIRVTGEGDRSCVEGEVDFEGQKSSVAFDVWKENGSLCVKAVRVMGSCLPSPAPPG